MKINRLVSMISATLLALLAISDRMSAQGQVETKRPNHYKVKDIGTLGGTFAQAFGVNNKGWVVGYSTTGGDQALHAFLWRDGKMTDLGSLGGADNFPYSQGNSVSDAGQVAGFSETSDPDPLGENFCGDSLVDSIPCLPVIWRAGVPIPLPTLGGNNGIANGSNNRGQVVGSAENSTHDPTCVAPQVLQFKPVVWENGGIKELPTIAGDPDGFAIAINDHGEAVGVTIDCGFATPGHNVIWHNGEVTDLGSQGGLVLGPSDINNRSQVTGTAFDPVGTTVVAFVWQNFAAKILGTLPGDVESHGNSINDKGQVEGQSCDSRGFPHCSVFIWQNGVMADLNRLIPANSHMKLVDSGEINAQGQIVGLGIHPDRDVFFAFIATPCDEDQAQDEGCADSTEGGIVADGYSGEIPKAVLPESVRQLLQRSAARRFPIPGTMRPASR